MSAGLLAKSTTRRRHFHGRRRFAATYFVFARSTSDTAPVSELVRDGQNRLLCDFFDVDRMFAIANRVLDSPVEFRKLGEAGMQMIEQEYDLVKCLPLMLDLYERTVSGASPPS